MSKRSRPAFEALVEAHAREIHSFVWRMLQDEAEADDVLQESFMKAFQAFERLDPSANFRAWLYTIAGNTARTRLRRRLRTASLLREDALDDTADVETKVEQRMLLESVREAVETLPYKQRISLILRRYQDLSYEEIGEVLDTSAEAARANVHQATKKLRAQFEHTGSPNGAEVQGEKRSQTA